MSSQVLATSGGLNFVPGVGIAYRPAFLELILARELPITHIEISLEHNVRGQAVSATAQTLAQCYPCVLHSVSLSPGSNTYSRRSEMLRCAYLAAQALGPMWVSDHISFSGVLSSDSFSLLPVPRTEHAATCIAMNATRLARATGCPVVLEYAAAAFDPGGDYDELDFVLRVLQLSGAGILLDLHNLYANSLNRGIDANAFLDGLPADRIVQVHLAGGRWAGAVYLDSHDSDVPEEVFDLLTRVLRRVRPLSVVLERDGAWPDPPRLLSDLQRAHALYSTAHSPQARLELGVAHVTETNEVKLREWDHALSERLAEPPYINLVSAGPSLFAASLEGYFRFGREVLRGQLHEHREVLWTRCLELCSRPDMLDLALIDMKSRATSSEHWRLDLNSAILKCGFSDMNESDEIRVPLPDGRLLKVRRSASQSGHAVVFGSEFDQLG